MRCSETNCWESLNPKVQGSIPCASTICVSGDAPARQNVPFDADRCHQLGVSRTAETTSFTPEMRHNASNCRMHRQASVRAPIPVSYTHLTLPTIYSV